MAVQELASEKVTKKPSVFVSYNGMNESFEYTPAQAAEAIRVHALNHYDIRGVDREQVFLFSPDNQTEVRGDVAIGVQVEPGSQLYLRPRTAGGG